MNKRAWFIIMLQCFLWMTGFSAQLRQVSVSHQSGRTSLYLTIQGTFTHKVFALPNPERIVIDLSTTSLATKLNQVALQGPLIHGLRSGMPAPNALRLVLDINQKVRIQSSPWRQGGQNGIRLDLMPQANQTKVSNNNPSIRPGTTQQVKSQKPIRQGIMTHQTAISVPRLSSKKPLRNVIVVLDAGHGGKDPGARGPHHSHEKNIVLAITLKLKRLIDKEPGMQAVLTRSGDYYVGLRNRLDIARKYNGDVFVSIHADAFNNPHSSGASVFALSQSGATSEAARWIAEKENYSELGGVNLGDLDDTNGVVRSVLIDLSQTATINSGLHMGGRVLSQLNQFTHLHNNKVEQARFVVLKSPDIPSILVETGFISNPIEEKNLMSSRYQDRLSQAIFQGVKAYFWDNPPHGSRIEAMASNQLHIVRKGETLPSIAARYHVSLNSLMAINRLSANRRINPGKKLVIPSKWA